MNGSISRDSPLRVLIVGNRPAAREALRNLLGAEAALASRTCGVDAAAESIARWPPDVVLVDLDGIGESLTALLAELAELRRGRPGAALILLGLSESGESSGAGLAPCGPAASRGGLPWARLAEALRRAVRSFGAAGSPATETFTAGAPARGDESAEAVPLSPCRTSSRSPTSRESPAAGSPSRREAAGLRPGSVLYRLSPRELEVLRHLAQGLTVGQCAQWLDLAHSTVDNHKARLMRKLGVHRTAELVRIALREGPIEP